MGVLDWFRMIFGLIFILFVPGFSWSYLLFKRDRIDWVERIALSVGISIALVPLAVLWFNFLFGMGISLLSVSLLVCFLTVIPLVYFRINRYLKRKVKN